MELDAQLGFLQSLWTGGWFKGLLSIVIIIKFQQKYWSKLLDIFSG